MSRPDDHRDEEAMLDRLTSGTPPKDADEAAARAPYERLLDRARSLARPEPPPAWGEGIERRLRLEQARERRRKRLVGGAILATAATVLVFFLWPRDSASPPSRLAVTVTRPDGATMRGDVAVGARVDIELDDPAPWVELRVYRDNDLVLRCPGDATCRGSTGRIRASLLVTAAGIHRIAVLTGPRVFSAPTGDGLEADALQARKNDGRFRIEQRFIVTP